MLVEGDVKLLMLEHTTDHSAVPPCPRARHSPSVPNTDQTIVAAACLVIPFARERNIHCCTEFEQTDTGKGLGMMFAYYFKTLEGVRPQRAALLSRHLALP